MIGICACGRRIRKGEWHNNREHNRCYRCSCWRHRALSSWRKGKLRSGFKGDRSAARTADGQSLLAFARKSAFVSTSAFFGGAARASDTSSPEQSQARKSALPSLIQLCNESCTLAFQPSMIRLRLSLRVKTRHQNTFSRCWVQLWAESPIFQSSLKESQGKMFFLNEKNYAAKAGTLREGVDPQ